MHMKNRLSIRRSPWFFIACFVMYFAALVPAQNTFAAPTKTITPDGGHYEGEMKDGVFHGRGKIIWSDGTFYEGGFENGLYAGLGKMHWIRGNRYTGEFKNGQAHGKGRMEYVDGAIYEGDFQDDRLHGSGRLVSKYEEYRGAFKDDLYWGYGSLKGRNGMRYEGGFVKGEFHGKGKYTRPSGESYEGRFAYGEFIGPGKATTPQGASYQGEFSQWLFHGKGVLRDPMGNRYQGTFSNGELKGPGKMVAANGSRYEGEFESSLFHGHGVFEDKEGRYEGEFRHGRFHGAGTYRYSTALEDGTTERTGLWRYGEFVDVLAEKQAKENVETALYNQSRLLAETLDGIAPSDPGKIDMYFLSIGGDGSQEVFRRETEYVTTQFEKNFSVAGRAVNLVNSRSTVSQKPMATVTSIRKSLEAIAAKMDKDKDILFLFMTSHGSKDHDFILDQNGMDLRNLSAAKLQEMLKSSGIKWKALVISACYSGGFIDHLKDEYTLIITAAAHDKKSFGCSDENDFTYFGRAFFEQALPNARSFDDAFDKAKLIVNGMEKNLFAAGGEIDEANHSDPQIHKPEAILAHLERWRSQNQTSFPAP